MTLVVGVPVSLTGQFQAQGRQTLVGLQTWCRDANAASLDSEDSFQLLYYDDASDSATVREITRRLIVDDRVDLLIGPYSSVLTSAAAQVADEYGKLLWNQGGASDNVYQQGYRWIVGILTPASRYLVGLLPLVRRTDPSANSVALLRASTGEFPKAICAGVTETAASLGFGIVFESEFDASCQDFTAELAKIEAAEPDVVVIVGRVQNDLRLARQLVESSIDVGVVVAVAAGIQGFQDDLGSLAERFVGPSQWEPNARYIPDFGPTTEQVMASFARDGHQSVDYPMAQAYAAGVVVQRCLETAGSADSHDLREAVASLQFSTFYGSFQIDSEIGMQIGRETLLVQWQDGQKAIVWPQSSGNSDLVYPWR